ncbi:DEAD-box ATP-dependent RNA helicase 38 [Acorus calamus]|uniref:RNA helicase n=1 Tax=Acorus calamus TaxID=4465 RepID=A0AAV9F6K2_ACOCL|nr:DEAD-box ATP-dependent RNA helicase 38 [Acorus calamus]
MAETTTSTAGNGPVKPRTWGDEVEEEEQEQKKLESSNATPSPDLEKIEKLTISDESEPSKTGDDEAGVVKKNESLLHEPDELKVEIKTGDTIYESASTFEDLNLSAELLRGLHHEMGFVRPSKIQAISLPMILTPPYKNLVAQAHNGSGKTTCFVVGMLSRVDPSKKVPQAICICPTRELAMQNDAVLSKMGKHMGITSLCAIPTDSASYVPMAKRLPVTEQVIIGTPGTIKKYMSARKLSVRDVNILVFDEADHMLAQDGFRDDSERIMKDIVRSNGGCQVLLFSATFNEEVKAFVSRVVKDANEMYVEKEKLSLATLKQYKVHCPDELAKIQVIKDKIFEFGKWLGQRIIFVHARNSARMLHDALSKEGYECTSIHGAMQQEDRNKIVKEFKDGLTDVLISTDLLARGFDQAQVNCVVNFDLPAKFHSPTEPDDEVYLHRIGRAGRFGRRGVVFNLICSERDRVLMEKIERNYEHHVAEVRWDSNDDFEKALKEAGLA